MPYRNRKAILLSLTLFISVLAILPGVYNGHASISFVSTFQNGCAPCGATFTVGPQTISTSIALVVSIYVEGAACTMTVTDSLSTSFGAAKICGSSSSTHPAVDIFAGITTSSGSDTVTVSSCGGGGANCEAIITTYAGVTGFGVVATTQQQSQPQGTFTNTVTLAGLGTQSWIVDSFSSESSTSQSASSSQTVRSMGSTVCPTGTNTCQASDIPAATPLSWSWTGSSGCNPGLCGSSQSAVELLSTGGLPPPSSLVGCFGNCGSPAITLANTNSTHTVAFNTSITLLYEWQNNLNGYVNNVTVPIAKAYTNQFVGIEIYIVHGCPQGQTPFSPTCPAFGFGHLYGPALSKGRLTLSFNNFQIVVAAGDFLAVGVSAFYQPFDINDTNTAVQAFQTGGITPSPITNTQVFNGAFKMGLWAYVTGTTVGNAPPTPPAGTGNSCATLDCILPNIVNSFCTNLTQACQTGSAFLWIIILTGISILTIVYFMAQVFPGLNPKALGLGELAIIVFIGWLVSFTSLGLMPAFFMVLIFLIVSWLFVGRVRGTGPI